MVENQNLTSAMAEAERTFLRWKAEAHLYSIDEIQAIIRVLRAHYEQLPERNKNQRQFEQEFGRLLRHLIARDDPSISVRAAD